MRKGMVADTLSRKVHRLRGTAAADGLSHPSPAPGHSGHSARLSGAWPMASGGREGAQSVDPTKGTQRVLIPSQQGTIPSPASRRPLSPSSRARPLRAQRAAVRRMAHGVGRARGRAGCGSKHEGLGGDGMVPRGWDGPKGMGWSQGEAMCIAIGPAAARPAALEPAAARTSAARSAAARSAAVRPPAPLRARPLKRRILCIRASAPPNIVCSATLGPLPSACITSWRGGLPSGPTYAHARSSSTLR